METDRQAVHIDDVEPVEVAPGIIRRRLTATGLARGWLIDFAPGTQWPEVDVHEGEERYYVLSGEVIEGETRYREGSYVVFAAGSRHQPRTETGARMLGINLLVG
ncbi:cupin domain-containing protein [Nonomuraea sp. NPDC049129]|uniref:cupin domain-containing protein n=1 Tax=Nonomuraea sp. NPDC049129 TaxID=3155272 RepID=UPI00340C19E1